MTKGKALATVGALLIPLFGLAFWGFVAPDQAVSRAERRKLAQAPELNAEDVFSGRYAEDLETYLLDQFPGRDGWRKLQARLRFDVFRQKDSNGVYLHGGQASRLEYPLKEDQVRYAAKKINSTIETYLQGSTVRFAVVPDKNFFLAEDYPHLDYDRMFEILEESIVAPQIDLMPYLTIDDYYRTDAHWRQERIFPAAQAVADGFGLGVALAPETGFERHELSPFYGVYYGQSALDLEPDVLTYLSSPAIDAASMTGPELAGETPVYTVERFTGMDGYDVFCAGAQSILAIESPLARTDCELIVFRDSYGSALAPLLLEGYRRVTLIDLRYAASSILEDYVDFYGQDVLFLYSTSLLNSGMLLR